MFNYGPKKELQKRPEKEPKFSMQNKTDKYIVIFIIVGLAILAILITLFVLLYYFL